MKFSAADILELVGRRAENVIQSGIRQGAQKFVDTFKQPHPPNRNMERLGFILSALGAGYLFHKLVGPDQRQDVQAPQTVNNVDPYAFVYSGQPQMNSQYYR